MAKAQFNLDPIETWINNIKGEVAQEAADAIIRQLQIKGPYWTGNFAGAWEARLGNSPIPADKVSYDRDKDVNEKGQSLRQIETYVVQEAPKNNRKNVRYTIDNRMVYRDVAKDLVPDTTGVLRGEKPGRTAPLNWYTTYLQGGGLATTLALATNRVSKDPEILQFKGNLNK